MTGKTIPVRGWDWGCESCGRDKRRALVEMVVCAVAASGGVYSFVTLTHLPIAIGVPADATKAEAQAERPPTRHIGCDPETHVMRSQAGEWQWRLMLGCPVCVREDSRMFTLWLKRMRRRWPTLEALPVREEHPGEWSKGVLHTHVIITGLRFELRGGSRPSRRLAEQWAEVGGGRTNCKPRKGSGSAAKVGWYVGKYVIKGAKKRQIARGFRVWRRTHGFAPDLRMAGYRPPVDLVASGRVDLTTGEISPSPWSYVGWWDDEIARAAAS